MWGNEYCLSQLAIDLTARFRTERDRNVWSVLTASFYALNRLVEPGDRRLRRLVFQVTLGALIRALQLLIVVFDGNPSRLGELFVAIQTGLRRDRARPGRPRDRRRPETR